MPVSNANVLHSTQVYDLAKEATTLSFRACFDMNYLMLISERLFD